MTDFCEHGTFESICNLCHRDNIIARLRAENFSLASWQCEFTDGKTGLVGDEHGNQYCAMAKRVEALTAEIERLRVALREAADELDAYYRAEYPGDHPYSQKKLEQAMATNPARAALDVK